jgi:hypothetical protein
VREEFLSAFDDALRVITRLEEVQKELEAATDDMDRMGTLLDELNDLQKKADRGNVYSLACAPACCAAAPARHAHAAGGVCVLTRACAHVWFGV